MKRILLLFGVLSLMAFQASAQRGGDPADYKTAIGARFNPWSIGFTAKHFIKGPHAIEGIASHYFGGGDAASNVTITGLYEYHWGFIPSKSEWNMYAGGGPHVGIWRYRYFDGNGRRDYETDAVVGVSGIFGVEYTFKQIPLNLSGDIKPFVNFTGGNDFLGEQLLGVSARYTFGRGR